MRLWRGTGVIRVYRPINAGFSYMSGWTEIWKGDVDYTMSLYTGRGALELRNSPSFDKYGRIFWGLAADYSLTQALTFRALTNLQWTDTAVDTKGTLASTATGIMPSGICTGTAAQCSSAPGAGVAGVAGNPFRGGKERYLGNEWILGLTYRFAPNMTFNLVGAALITGDALNHQRTGPVGSGIEPCATNGVPTCQSRNVYKLSARFRLTF